MTTYERLDQVRKERAKLWETFMSQGGRGVELAEEIDSLDEEIAELEGKVEDARKDNYR